MHQHQNREMISILLTAAPETAKLSKLLRETVVRWSGSEKSALSGENVRLFVFNDAEAALAAAKAIHGALSPLYRSAPSIALASGNAGCFEDFVYGVPVSIGEILLEAAHPGQILASDSFKRLLTRFDTLGFQAKDLGEQRFRSLPRRVRVWQFTTEDQAAFPPIHSIDNSRHNLPNNSTSFVGRTSDLEAISDYLTFSRVVTLLGTAGAGKTRLAIQAGYEQLDNFSDGVFLIRLAEAEEGVHVPSLMAQALRLDGKDLEAHLQGKQMLFIFDNCEHVVEDIYAVTRRFLETHTDLCFLLTSRQPILPGVEQEHYVEPLSLPVATPSRQGPLLGEAVRLFVERLLLYRPTFKLDIASAQLIAKICARLEGLPLAIELAAARARLLSLEEVYEALDDELSLLRRTDDRTETLHGTMTGTIEWSFRLLDYHESRLLSRLSIFVGGFTSSSAFAVGDFGDIPSVDQALDQLVAKSLIFPIESTTYESRFRMLEPIRRYAYTLLESPDEVLERLLTWSLDWTASCEPELNGPNVSTILRTIDAELGNIRAALAYGLENEPERALDLVLSLHRYWLRSLNHEEGRRWAQRVLEFIEPGPTKKAQALNLIGSSCFLSDDPEAAQGYLVEALAIYEQLGMTDRCAVISGNIAMVEVSLGDRRSAERHFQQTVEILRRAGDQHRLLNGLANIANFYRDEEPEISLMYLKEALELARDLNERFQECHCLAMAATVQAETGRFDEARDSLLAFLRMHDYPDPKRGLMALEAATRLALEEEDPRRARRWLQICDSLRSETGIKPGARLERIEALRGRIKGAGLAIVRKQEHPPQLQRTLSQVAKWLAKTGPTSNRNC